MYSLTYGEVSFKEMVSIIKAYSAQDPHMEFVIAVGTDSQNSNITKVPVTVGIHKITNKVGKGGIYFYEIIEIKKINNIRQKIFYETNMSIELALKLSQTFEESNIPHEIEVHVDVGYNGPTSQYVAEIKGWVKACGFQCVVKPDSYMASSVANRLSK
ncbi:ribonuclease H-like YkuK family protein [Desulfosporosinus nitroreducens]|uniref:ribonuclease H-like YkuK family protein n=1 Tax=Desulfosporosinus nitroreducens TaxID=2018668 RepID=UPI00207C208D|nr:ribonuclease H-like YkuK family protein [Desulfosporosinus nitroreducens]MCO1601625.1 ribonuclease H-like YkuK family protein [Desulfosporosinus nitroreducens]